MRRLIKIDYENGSVIDYSYDANGNRLSEVVSRSSFASIILAMEGFYHPIDNILNRRDTTICYLMKVDPPFNVIDSSVQVLDSIFFEATFEFNNAAMNTNYYLRVRHRNSIETWSKPGGEYLTDFIIYDFTSLASQAFGDNLKLKGSKWCVYSGDVNQDGFIDVSDLVSVFNNASNFVSGYVNTDVTGDNFVDVSDLIITFNNANDFVSVVRP